MDDLNDDFIEKLKQILLSRLSELHEIQNSSSDSRKTVELDQSSMGRLSRMDAMQGQQMAAETGRQRTIKMQRIQSALGRIESGDYGFCIKCDEPIALKRLEVDPAALICIDCARKS